MESPRRSTEAYWILWAHTKSGGETIKRWKDELPGLGVTREPKSSRDTQAQLDRKSKHVHKRDSGFGQYEVQRFLRQLLTSGTKLNRGMKPPWDGFSAEDLIALALLKSPNRTLTESNIVRQVNKVFKRHGVQDMPPLMRKHIKSALKREETSFDNEFVLVGHVRKWGWLRPMFRLPAGHENKILMKKWHKVSPVTYLDNSTPDCEDERILDDLPIEIQLMVVRYLVKFDTKIHIVIKTGPTAPANMAYDFVIARPSHLIKTDSTGVDGPYGPHRDKVWSVDASVLALASTSKYWRELVQSVFFRENRFVIGNRNTSKNSKRHHYAQWRKFIGVQALAFLRERIKTSKVQ